MPTVEAVKPGEIKYVTPYPGRGRPSRERKALRDAEIAAGYLVPEKPAAVVRLAKPEAAPKPSQKAPKATAKLVEAPAPVLPLKGSKSDLDAVYSSSARNLAEAALAAAKGNLGEGAVYTIAAAIARTIERERASR